VYRDLKIKPISECRFDERLKTKIEEHLKIKTRLIDEKFVSVMGEVGRGSQSVRIKGTRIHFVISQTY
jgi:hypothetical protein